MKAIKKVFGGLHMTWLFVVIYSVAIAVLTAGVLLLTRNTDNAFRNLGATYEMWFPIAIVVIANCEKAWEAGLKTFVFFLISQPLIYLLQQPFADINLLKTYYMPWFIITLATLPGAMIAFFIKKDNLIGTIIISVAGAVDTIMGSYYIYKFIGGSNFTYLLYGLLCLFFSYVFLVAFVSKKGLRILYICIMIAAIAGGIYIAYDADMTQRAIDMSSGIMNAYPYFMG